MRYGAALSIFAFVFAVFSSCAHAPHYFPKNTSVRGKSLPERLSGRSVGGHQGSVFGLKFNTIAGFTQASNVGADIVEMDLRVSKEGSVVVYHDATLDRWTDCSGALASKNIREINNCRYTLSGEKIPTFEQVVLWSDGNIIINAEFKETEAIIPAIAVVKKYYAYEWVYFQATSWEKYTLARKIDKNIYLLFPARNQADLVKALALHDNKLLVIEIYKETRTPENIKMIHAAGKLVSEDSWHFNPLKELFGASCTDLFQGDIDIAITNRPEGCIEQREALQKKTKKLPYGGKP